MSIENPTLEDFGINSNVCLIELAKETMGKLIAAETKIERVLKDSASLHDQNRRLMMKVDVLEDAMLAERGVLKRPR